MQSDFDLFLAIAEIAGVFVAFAALITVSRSDEAERGDVIRLGGVVTVGVYTIFGALVPVCLGRYGLGNAALWKWSSAVFLCVIWLGIIALTRAPAIRAFVRQEFAQRPVFAIVFWVFLEIPVHLTLLLILSGISELQAAALYTTALVLCLLEGALALSQLVYLRVLRI